MWAALPLLAAAAAPAADPPPARIVGPVEDAAREGVDGLPLQVQYEERWGRIDQRASRTARASLVVSGVSLAATTSGLALLGAADFGDRRSEPYGIALVTAGAVTGAAAMPTYLASVARSHRSLKERGVFGGAGAVAGAWTTFGMGLPLSVAFVNAPVVYPVWGGAVLALGCAQAAHDDRARRGAGLGAVRLPWQLALVPRPDGVTVAAVF